MKQQTGAENYTVKSFMRSALGLKGSELQVYAVIYSFSRDGIGEFSGSREYLAYTIGFSEKTVSRALVELDKKGYISKRRSPLSNTHIYRANLNLVREALEKSTVKSDASEALLGQNGEDRFGNKNEPFWGEDTDKLSTNNKEDNKEIINTTTTTAAAAERTREEKKTEEEILTNEDGARASVSPHYSSQRQIKNGWQPPEKSWFDTEVRAVPMKKLDWEGLDYFITEEQYEHLEALLGTEELVRCYFGRVKAFEQKNPKAHFHSVYHLILKWARKDLSAEKPK